jgi:ribosomal protein L16 Arg81 hydroxylase
VRTCGSFADHEEVFGAGDAFYIPPGHTPRAEAGSEFVQFSPSEQLKAVEATIMENMRQMQSAPRPELRVQDIRDWSAPGGPPDSHGR